MKNYLLMPLLLIVVMSCNKDEAQSPVDVPINHWENQVELRIQSMDGADLLNIQNEGYYQNSDIDVLESNDAPNAVSINKYPETDYYYLTLNVNYPKVDLDKGKTYDEELISKVTFGNNETDVIKGLYNIKYHEGNAQSMGASSGYTVILQKAWFNNVQIYDKQTVLNTDWEIPIIIKSVNK